MNERAKRIATLSPKKRALLLERVAEQKARANQGQERVPRRDASQPAPLSFAQQRMWFVDQLEPGSPLYNVPGLVRLEGELSVESLERGLREVMLRHEALRTTIRTEGDVPLQSISPEPSLVLAKEDLSRFPESEKETEAQRLALREAQRPFDLEKGPLMRATLVRLGATQHLLVVVLHHIISDGWSLGVIIREIAALYAAFTQGLPSPLAPVPVQYADYSAWQRKRLKGDMLEKQLEYWRGQLAGISSTLDLPTDGPRPSMQGFRGGRQEIELPRALTEALRALGNQESASLFMVLLTGLEVLLSRLSGQEDVCVGTPVAGRTRAELEGMVGLCINTLALRTRVEGRLSFREMLRRTREVTLAAFAHQDVPFERLVEELQPARDPSRTPIFQVLFVLQNTPRVSLPLPTGLTLRPLALCTGTSMFDLSLDLEETPEGLTGYLEYSSDLFEPSTVERMARHLQSLLEGAAAHPDERVGSLPLMAEAEHRRCVAQGLGPRVELPREACLHELFSAQALQTPDALAATFEGQQLSFRELDARSNQLAHALHNLGVGPESLVGLCVERSLEMLVGMLGILKAGGAYLPLDPSLPHERLAFLLDDSRAPVLLTQEHLAHSLPSHRAQVLLLDGVRASWTRESEAPVAPGASADNLAYVIYTSGSTGRPKGTLVCHRGVCNLVRAEAHAYGIGPDSRVLQAASPSFDISVEEVFTTLLSGGTLCLAHSDELMPGPSLHRLLNSHAISVLSLTPAALAATPHEDLPALRTVISGGEACTPELVSRWSAPNRTFLNTYGPTEATVVATLAKCTADGRTPPIGRALPNVEVYVLDRWLQPVPVGVHGELFIGGVGLARGYLGLPALTAERFVPHPFAPEPGARLYRSGDVVRWRADGNLDFIGRTDAQVKIRGFRIELGEVETVLRQHPHLSDAAVIAHPQGPNDNRLVAYVVFNPDSPRDSAALRSFLRQKLPEYMVPSAFVLLHSLPLTSNAKVDRNALPPPESSFERTPSRPPHTEIERALARIWAQVLHVEHVGAEEDFFALGGHSLLATQIVSRVRSELGIELPLRALFEEPTVAALALRVGKLSPSAAHTISPAPRNGPLPLSFAQQRMWFLDQLEPGTATYNIPGALHLRGRLDVEALRRALETVVARHEVLRTTFALEAGEPVQVTHPPAAWALPRVDLRDVAAEARAAQVEHLLREEARHPFDLVAGPLMRTRLVELADDEHVITLVMHHVVSDEWSEQVLFRELAAIYGAYVRGEQPGLPELPIQYADYARWQRSWLQGEALERELSYWKEHLAGLPTLDLPTDRPRPAAQSHRGAEQSFVLAPKLALELRELARAQSATLYMTILAAFEALLYRYTGQSDFGVGTPVAGRDRPEVEGLIGLFVNTLVLRTHLSGDPRFTELLGRVRETALGAQAHQSLPFERLVDELGVERHMSRTPLFQVMFTYQSAREGALALPGVTLDEWPMAADTSKLDLTLTASDVAGGISCTFEYSTDLFDTGTIERMAGHLQALLAGIVRSPNLRISELPLLTAPERRQALLERSRTRRYSNEETLGELFEAQVTRTPDAVAVQYEETRLSYRELDARANQLAHVLRARGVGPEVPVAFCLDRGIEPVIALLGILKAGGAYVPIDPIYPAERRAYIVEDSKAPLLITSTALSAEVGGIAKLVLDEPAVAAELVAAPSQSPMLQVSAAGLAYVIYTSGSTGRPKGSMISHSSVVRLMRATEHWYHFDEHDCWTVFHSFAFDFSVWEIWGALLYGGRALVVPHLTSRSPQELLDLLERERVTVLNQTPSAFRVLMQEALSRESVDLSLRWVVFGGEALEIPGLRPWFERFGDSAPALVNMYGITETTVHVTYRKLRASDAENPASVIGEPIPDLPVHVLDGAMNLLPVGVYGELYVGGPGCSRGYLGRPELTAERFLPDPYSTEPGRRLYKTGDIGRRLLDGGIEYLGRADAQVKIRGFRIELGEIESALNDASGVRGSVVVAREDVPGEKRLVAYVAAAETVSTTGLREHLRRTLPDYMVPSAFVLLESLPLTPHGKVDRRALPAPELGASPSGYVAPTTEAEQALCGAVAEVLGVAQVGLRDSFFALGGHSLLVIRLLDRLRRTGWNASARDVFEAPDVGELAERLRAHRSQFVAPPNLIPADAEKITPELLNLVALEQTEIDRIAAAIPGGARNIQDIYPPTPLQEGFIYEHLATREDPYLSASVLHFASEQDLRRFVDGLQQLVARHDILRTAVLWSGLSRPVQVVQREARLPVEWLDSARAYSEEELLDLGRALAIDFDLNRAPLVRAKIARNPRGGFSLLLALHHLIDDNMLLRNLDRELRELAAGRSLPPASSFRDFVAYVLSRDAGASEGFWREQLAGLEEPTLLAGLRAETRTLVERELPRQLDERLRALCRASRVSPAALFHVAFALVLAKYTGREDVIFGTVLSGRSAPLPGLETAAGMFLSTLPVRLRLQRQTVREAVQHMQTLLGVLPAHEHLPLPQIQAWSSVRPPLPLFDALFNYRHAVGREEGGGSDASVIGGRFVETTHYPLSVSVDSTSDHTRLTVEGAGALSERLYGSLEQTLTRFAASFEQPLASVEVMHETEYRRCVAKGVGPRLELPREVCLHELFGAQALRTPEGLAATFEGQQLSFRELDARSNQLAHALRALGVGPETLVGLCVERSLEMLVGLLGILKAGGAYLPLDPTLPPERLAFLLDDCGAPVLLTQECLEGRLPTHGARVVLLDGERASWRRESEAPVAPGAGADNLAYVIYTSGSTGRPKGTLVTHRGANNLVQAEARAYGIGPGSRVLQVARLSFDLSVAEIFTTLLAGGTLCLARSEELMPGPSLHRVLERDSISVLRMTPAALAATPHEDLPALRAVMSGGEACTAELVARWSAPGRTFINAYGPTECTVVTTQAKCTADGNAPSIGRPLPNVEVYVLDQWLRPLPIGVQGELYIGGVGLARGYLGRPDLTAQRFVPHPFSAEPGARLYRSGDLARWREDGYLELIGRSDAQVKVRGFRIELGEVEAVLRQHPDVSDSVVVARDQGPGDKRLVAYAVPRPGALLDGAALRSFLRQQLPEYMIPSTFVLLRSLPLTPSAKVDRSALPDPDGSLAVEAGQLVAPRDELELQLVRLWERLLGVQPLGIRNDFFELGGHSLLAVKMTTAIHQLTGHSLPLASLFQAPTIEQLARLLRQERRPWSPLVLLEPSAGDRCPFFCVHPAGGNVLAYTELARHLDSERPFYGLQAQGLAEGHTPLDTVEQMATLYLEAIRTVQPHGPYLLGGWSLGGCIAFEMAHQLEAQGERVALLALLDSYAPGVVPLLSQQDERGQLNVLFARSVAEVLGGQLPTSDEELAQMEEDALLDSLLQEGGKAGFVLLPGGLPQVRALRRVFEHTLKAVERYTPHPYTGPVLLLHAEQSLHGAPADRGWASLTAGPLESAAVPGDHESMVRLPHVRVLAERLSAHLSRAERDACASVTEASCG